MTAFCLRIGMIAGLAAVISGCQTAFWDETETPVPAAVVIGGADRYGQQAAPADFVSFTARARSGDFGSQIEEQRYSLLRDAAIAYAAQAGYERRVWQVMRQLERDSLALSKTFDFNRVAYRAPRQTGYILPPVVSRATAAISVDGTGQSAVAADEFYRIEIPGRIVSVVPTWRDYLIIPLDTATRPDDSFLPQNREERRVFDRFAAEGWQAGTAQADEALEMNFARLKRDYLGMIEYRKMVEAGLVKDLIIEASETRSAGEGNELFIGERRVAIVSAAEFVRDPRHWTALQHRYAVVK